MTALRTSLLIFAFAAVGCSRRLPPLSSGADPTPASRVLGAQAREEPLLLDVRTPEEYAAGHIDGAKNIPYDEIEARAHELPQDKNREIVVCCRSGRRSAIAEKGLRSLGYLRVRDAGACGPLKAPE